MTPRRIAALIAGLLALASVAAIALVMRTPSPPYPVAQQAIECAQHAPSGTVAFTLEQSQEAEACMERVLTAGIESLGMAGTHRELAKAEMQVPLVGQACHAPAHTVGAQAAARGVRIVDELAGMTEESCQSGLIHGMFDQWATTQPARADFTPLAQACAASGRTAPDEATRMRITGRCADAAGHAVWAAFGTPDACADFTDLSDQDSCAGGVVMQMYLPVSANGPVPGVTLDDVVALCRDWPAQLDKEGCATGAAYAFRYPYVRALEQVAFGKTTEQQARGPVTEGLQEALSWCAKVDDPALASCARALAAAMPPFAYTWPDLIGEGCALYPSPAQDMCRQMVAQHTGQQASAPGGPGPAAGAGSAPGP